jgi:hypothetical protein
MSYTNSADVAKKTPEGVFLNGVFYKKKTTERAVAFGGGIKTMSGRQLDVQRNQWPEAVVRTKLQLP